MTGKVILICGKICSGKSFYAGQIKKTENAVVLSTDEVTYDLTENAQGEDYPAFARRVNAYLLKKTAELAAVGCNVILDWGFWTRQDRREASEYLRTRNIPIEWHYMDVQDEQWHRNIRERNRKVLEGRGGPDFYVDAGLYRKVSELFEVPDREEMDVWHCVSRE